MKTRSLLSGAYICLLILLFSGCSNDIDLSNEQEVFFEVNYANNAWTYQFKGFLIDKEGRIRTYDLPAKWVNVAGGTTITVDELDANLSKTAFSSHSVPITELNKYKSEAAQVTDADFTKPENVGADMGGTSYLMYKYDPSRKVYKAILLKQTGDVVIYNKDSKAKEIGDWLTQITDQVY
jgi:hypothetical protein